MKFICSLLFVFVTNISFAQPSSSAYTDPVDSIFRIKFPEVFAHVGQTYPPFGFTRSDKVVTNTNLQGKVVLINFWFESCLPCMAEMEALNQLYDSLKTNKDFEFLSIAKEKEDAVKRVRKRFALTFPVICTTEVECKRLNFGSGYPTSIILDKTGVIRYIHVGGYTDKDGSSERVMNILLPEVQSLL